MENKSIHSIAAGVLRNTLNKPEAVPTAEPKIVEPVIPAVPADSTKPTTTTN